MYYPFPEYLIGTHVSVTLAGNIDPFFHFNDPDEAAKAYLILRTQDFFVEWEQLRREFTQTLSMTPERKYSLLMSACKTRVLLTKWDTDRNAFVAVREPGVNLWVITLLSETVVNTVVMLRRYVREFEIVEQQTTYTTIGVTPRESPVDSVRQPALDRLPEHAF